ncbi:MAG: TonB family protein [Acidobacteriia bacterium]|nr:TonB family protein [Terriglobia bacterium]
MQAPRDTSAPRTPRPVRPPQFLIELEPWHRGFLRNLRDTVRPRVEPMQMLTSRPEPFWPDVFVSMEIPRRPLLQSSLYHVFIVIALWGLSHTFVFRTRPVQNSFFHNQRITYYDVSEYLPAIDTGSTPAKEAKKGEPEYSKQRIISAPPHPDNSTQTIIDPVNPRLLTQEAKLPNMVVWTQAPAPPVASRNLAKLTAPALVAPVPPPVHSPARTLSQLAAPKPENTAVAPAPDAGDPNLAKLNLPKIAAAGVVAPAPDAGQRDMGDINIGRSELVATNPALPMPEQRAANLLGGSGAAALAGVAGAVPPPPAVDSGGGIAERAAGQFVALSVRPSPPAGPIEIPGGNRRGIFAATPEGKPGAPGTPDIAGGGKGGGNGSGSSGAGNGGGDGGGPTGISVGGAPATASSGAVVASAPPAHPVVSGEALKRSLLAAAAPHRLADIARATAPGSTMNRPDAPETGKIEDKVFGPKKYYSMILNMPNLTSAGGSWIMRFAELKQTGAPGELTAPVAMSKVDPAYPPELMRKNVEGTVTLYAVIRADGTVGEIRVLEGLDDKLDENAKRALGRWHFRPATKNGNAVDLEAVVFIPFKARKASF